jgi:hypothetical protein
MEAGVLDIGESITAIVSPNVMACPELAVVVGTINGRVHFIGENGAEFAVVRDPVSVAASGIRNLCFSDDWRTIRAFAIG